MINEIRIDNSMALIEKINSYSNAYVFRGHSNSVWRLQTTLQRNCAGKYTKEFAQKMEEYTLNVFKSKFHIYDKENEAPHSLLEWLSVMQHYGVPTRLLDFTLSPYVALYFAIESIELSCETDLALYAVNYSEINNYSLTLLPENCKTVDQNCVFDEILKQNNQQIIWVTEPSKLNVRMDRQLGSFITCGAHGCDIEETFKSNYSSIVVDKLIISKSMFEQIFALLRKVNITGSAIYGDLSGLSKTIAMQVKVYSS